MAKTIKLIINIILTLAMLIHLSTRINIHLNYPEFISPLYIELLYIAYYVIPLVIINLIFVIYKKSE
ncbi:MAG: hypothetical protein ATN36_01855 [Epulopiscium sp. Nele67-Bin005]|nr:MAG: hypothetical protein ATN36_01855 [Epulopiscium sp. Nele67-Bin005]